MKIFSHFRFNKNERSGIFFLLLLIILAQAFYFLMASRAAGEKHEIPDNTWVRYQEAIDSLKRIKIKEKDTVYPFNPNYISDYKGYVLGMTVEEIDRLRQYRAAGKFVNTVSGFREVTGISDSLLDKISPYFRFPSFAKNEGTTYTDKHTAPVVKDDTKKKDLNAASADDFMVVRGIGRKLSARIVKYRALLGGFSVNQQLYEVYGLDSAIVNRALQYFDVVKPPEIEVLDINSVSLNKLASLVYLDREDAVKIIAYRSEHEIGALEELTEIEGFSSEKINRIRLYLRVK
ncbi:helix-hairpin-helix domain-containing protein [Sinomicrobium kalidii]|uniref:ComEA family DNA-binding protein n=1 Tax=Sinomicrobium kalidii TaxID=2900738 RepID=UPI001E54D0AE|nr:helix-hairpin-helix domain-containing protein [Sinomicrobium kalidii]UGU17078.1 helix-hairpin-helix domain-containing protein [Sinomicrobium kalidii]